MLRRLAALALPALALNLGGCPVLQSQDTPVPEFKVIASATSQPYWMYVPSQYEPTRRWGLVITLHGTHGFDDGQAQVREWKSLAEAHGFIVMAPQLVSPQGILQVSREQRAKDLIEDDRRVQAALEEVTAKYSIDTSDVMLTGFSAGGIPMYWIGLKHPELFHTLCARSANCDVTSLQDIAITDAAKKMRVLIFYGKTGINPGYSRWSPIYNESWEAFRYLLDHGLHKDRVKVTPMAGGHERRPDVAYKFWAKGRQDLIKP